QQPLVTDSQNKEVLKCEVKYSYTVITNLVSVLCESQLPRFKELVAQRTLRKPPLVAVVFLYAMMNQSAHQVNEPRFR
ncbi:hypothetical protein, partial [Klebsiella pneumoniae]|uniref:hypothetical protein n=1 Tax=Klebsiella pneumoniae TaxID=573 RepID=UPI000CC68460